MQENLSHYEIKERIGAGGMGEVYRARDTKLGREVALKLLPETLASDPERRARFEREARAIAALNHPNIVTVHSIEEDGGRHFLTMELVEGKTLSSLIPPGGMSLRQFFEIAIPFSDALAAAHAQGILHRDLKPDNLMLNREGRVKVFDFGLAKLREEAADVEATVVASKMVTGEGRVLGTAAYMSPEQAEGKEVDTRSDIFSLGIVLYEMATGKRPFSGETTISTLSSILRDTPPLANEVNPALPRHLSRILKRCLAKDPSRRYQTALDVRNELEEFKSELDSGELTLEASALARPADSYSRWKWAAGSLLVLVLVLASYLFFSRNEKGVDSESGAKQSVTLTQLTDLSGIESAPALSADGRQLLYVKDGEIFLQRVGGSNPINLTHNSADDFAPAWSPDGQQIAFCSSRDGGGIFLMGATGESPRRLTDTGFDPAWSPDGSRIAYTMERVTNPYARNSTSALWVVEAASGKKTKLYDGDAVYANWSPDGKRIAFWTATQGQRDIQTIAASGGTPVFVTHDPATDWSPVWDPSEDGLYFISDRDGYPNIYRIEVDPKRGVGTGDPRAVTTGNSFLGRLSISAGGERIAYSSFTGNGRLERSSIDPATRSLGPRTDFFHVSNPLMQLRISHDGKFLAYSSSLPQEDLYTVRLDGSDRRRLTNDIARDRGPNWSPGDEWISFYSNRGGTYQLWSIHPDGTELRQLSAIPNSQMDGAHWSPDGKQVLSWLFGSGNDLPVLLDAGDPARWPITTLQKLPTPGPGEVAWPQGWSPDGKRILAIVGKPEADDVYLGLCTVATGKYEIPLREDGSRFHIGLSGKVNLNWLKGGLGILFFDKRERQLVLYDPDAKKTTVLLQNAPSFFTATATRDGSQVVIETYDESSDVWMGTLK
jgi:serine/threonine protein kinase